jgi:hypothetical protein
VSTDMRAEIIDTAASLAGTPYGMPPGPGEVDCSSYVLLVYEDTGLPFPTGIRTAEQIRQACAVVGWDTVLPGDLLFFEHTYEPSEPPGPDGRTASHIGISLGAGTFQMWNAVNEAVQLTDIDTEYWQAHLFEARMAPQLVAEEAGTPGVSGWHADANNPGWYLWAGSDAAHETSWTQTVASPPPAGFAPDPPNPGWYFTGGDPLDPAAWWSDETVVPPVSGTVPGIDVASYQPTDLSGLIRQTSAQHVVVRLYLGEGWEGPSQQISRDQIASAQACGCSVGAYMWLYAAYNPRESVQRALALAATCGLTLPILWIDFEPYTDGSLPSTGQLVAALEECERAGIQGGTYTGKWVWDQIGNPTTPAATRPLWAAQYDGIPTLTNVDLFGGWTEAHGKQIGDQPCDLDVFATDVV